MNKTEQKTEKSLEDRKAKLAEKGYKITQLPLPEGHTRIRVEKQPSEQKSE